MRRDEWYFRATISNRDDFSEKVSTAKGWEMTKISKFDAADYLKTPEQVAAYLVEAVRTGDAAFVRIATETIARANEASQDRTAKG